jgi:hypothetical protein
VRDHQVRQSIPVDQHDLLVDVADVVLRRPGEARRGEEGAARRPSDIEAALAG